MESRTFRPSAWLWLALLAPLAACGDSSGGSGSTGTGGDSGSGSTESTTSAGGGDPTGGSTTTGAGAGDPGCDPPDGTDTADAFRPVGEVTGTVIDTAGDPVDDTEVQVCGENICLYGTTSADGSVVVNNPNGDDLDRPVFKSGDGLVHTRIGYPLPEGDPVNVDAVLPVMVDSGTALAPGATAEADGVTLVVGAGVSLNLLDFSGPGEDTFRAGVVPESEIEAVAPGQGFDILIGTGPFDTYFCPPASLTVPNSAGLAPGAVVEFHVQSLNVAEFHGPYGEWVKVADGHVSEDGETVGTDEGQGIPVTAAVGIVVVE
jgi:hypothetical protein